MQCFGVCPAGETRLHLFMYVDEQAGKGADMGLRLISWLLLAMHRVDLCDHNDIENI